MELPGFTDGPTARTWFLSYETPGDGEDAWVIRSEQDGEVSHPEWVTDEIDGDDADAAKGWATEYLAGRGVPVDGWERVKGMEWGTWRAQVTS